MDGDNAILKAFGINMQSLDDALATLIDASLNGFHSADLSNMIAQLIQAMKDQATFQLMSDKLQQDIDGGVDNETLARDAMAMTQASSSTLSDLLSLQNNLTVLVATLKTEAAAAEKDEDRFSWMDGMTYFVGSERNAIERDNNIIAECNQLQDTLVKVIGQIGPVIAQMQNQIYATAALTLDELFKRALAIFFDPNLSDGQKVNEIKVILATALGILAMVESDAAAEKAENQQTAASATIYTAQMNMTDEQASLDRLQAKLEQIAFLTKLEKYAKPILDVAGNAHGPRLGSLHAHGRHHDPRQRLRRQGQIREQRLRHG